MGSRSTDRCQAQQFVRAFLLSAIRQAQHSQSPDNLLEAFNNYSRRVAVVIYEVKYGLRPALLTEVSEAMSTIVRETQVRAITITWE